MKKIISAILSLVILASAALCMTSCSNNSESEVPDGMKIASSDKADYRFYVPSGDYWICDVQSGASSAYYSSTDKSNISVMDYICPRSDYTVAEWWSSFENDFKSVYQDFEVISEDDVVLDGVAAVKRVFKGKLNVGVDTETNESITREYQFMQIAAIKRENLSAPKVYVITYTSLADGETFDSHLEDVQKMIDNFKFN